MSQMLPYPCEDVQGLHKEKTLPLGGRMEEKTDVSKKSKISQPSVITGH